MQALQLHVIFFAAKKTKVAFFMETHTNIQNTQSIEILRKNIKNKKNKKKICHGVFVFVCLASKIEQMLRFHCKFTMPEHQNVKFLNCCIFKDAEGFRIFVNLNLNKKELRNCVLLKE